MGHFCEIFKVLLIRDVLGYPLQCKRKVLASPIKGEEAQCLVHLLGSGYSIFHI